MLKYGESIQSSGWSFESPIPSFSLFMCLISYEIDELFAAKSPIGDTSVVGMMRELSIVGDDAEAGCFFLPFRLYFFSKSSLLLLA